MKKNRDILLCVTIICLLSLLMALVIFALPIGLRFRGDDVSAEASLHIPHQGWASACVSPNGTVYTLTKLGVLKCSYEGKVKNIAAMVDKMTPTDQGVLFSIFETLYYKMKDTTIKISNNVSSFAWNGKKVIYFSDGKLLTWDNGETEILGELSKKHIFTLLANESYVILSDDITGVFLYNENTGLDELPIDAHSSQQYLLYKDYLITVEVWSDDAKVCHLPTKTVLQISLGNFPPFDPGLFHEPYEEKFSAVGHGTYIYLSVHLRDSPPFEGPGREIKGTFRIDPNSWTAEKISSEFYEGLAYANDTVYGLDLSAIVCRWKALE